ncbi:hypothetical protein BGZ46_002998 [Entomortierella lignicola]|nr:hypothetical protein BGZ46_002998 [Entomortierella lignicola]
MSKNSIPALTVATVLSTIASSAEALTLTQARSYITRGLTPIFDTAALKSGHLQSRTLQKRSIDICSYFDDGTYYYCNSPYHCTSATTCGSYFWAIGVAVGIAVLILIVICIRRRRIQNANRLIATSVSQGQANPTVTYQPAMSVPLQANDPYNPPSVYNPPTAYAPYDPNTAHYAAAPAPYDPNTANYAASGAYQPASTPAMAPAPYYSEQPGYPPAPVQNNYYSEQPGQTPGIPPAPYSEQQASTPMASPAHYYSDQSVATPAFSSVPTPTFSPVPSSAAADSALHYSDPAKPHYSYQPPAFTENSNHQEQPVYYTPQQEAPVSAQAATETNQPPRGPQQVDYNPASYK